VKIICSILLVVGLAIPAAGQPTWIIESEFTLTAADLDFLENVYLPFMYTFAQQNYGFAYGTAPAELTGAIYIRLRVSPWPSRQFLGMCCDISDLELGPTSPPRISVYWTEEWRTQRLITVRLSQLMAYLAGDVDWGHFGIGGISDRFLIGLKGFASRVYIEDSQHWPFRRPGEPTGNVCPVLP